MYFLLLDSQLGKPQYLKYDVISSFWDSTNEVLSNLSNAYSTYVKGPYYCWRCSMLIQLVEMFSKMWSREVKQFANFTVSNTF